MYLDSLSLLEAQVGYGDLGMHGSLGYEGQQVSVQQQHYPHALSAHAPSRLVFQLEGRYRQFHCQVALNDDVPAKISHADFALLADGRQVARAPYVMAGESPREVRVNLTGIQTLELVIETTRWDYCHAVWLNPTVSEEPFEGSPRTLIDPLGRVEITLPQFPPSVRRCIATVVSPGFESWADNLLGSIRANGDCPDALLVLFAVEGGYECRRIASKYDAVLIICWSRTRVDVTVKAVLYSVARVIQAEQYLCLDADMIVLGSLTPIFEAIEAAPVGSILVAREANHSGPYKLSDALLYTYFGSPRDLRRILGQVNGEGEYPLVVNDGMFAGTAAALCAVDGVIRGMPQAIAWMEERRHVCWWRNQFIFNLALARLHCGVEVDGGYNVQLHTKDVQVAGEDRDVQVSWRGRPVRVLHFCGVGKQKYLQLQRLYAG
jgi:hypothetical protein